MNIHDATEIAYKNGYERGKTDTAREIIGILKSAGIYEWRYPVIAELKNEYLEGEDE